MTETVSAIRIDQITHDHGRVIGIEVWDETPDTCDSCKTVWPVDSLRYSSDLFLCPLCDYGARRAIYQAFGK